MGDRHGVPGKGIDQVIGKRSGGRGPVEHGFTVQGHGVVIGAEGPHPQLGNSNFRRGTEVGDADSVSQGILEGDQVATIPGTGDRDAVHAGGDLRQGGAG